MKPLWKCLRPPLLGLALTAAAGGAAARDLPEVLMTFGGNHRFVVTLEDTAAARAFAQLLPLTIDMPDLNSNEKHAPLPRSLPTSAVRPGTIQTGDVMLYGDQTLVVFYKVFTSSYSYTRIGRITDSAGLAEAIGAGRQRISFSVRPAR